jgi:Protein of unknown function (DUF3551)
MTKVRPMRTLASSMLVAIALFVAPSAALAQVGTGQFCLKSSAGQPNCNYQTMAQCEQAKPAGSSDQCIPRSQAGGTTGAVPGGSTPGAQPPPVGSPPPSPQR